MKVKKCRLDEDEKKGIRVCEHIAIDGEIKNDNETGEYIKELNIYCNICKKTYPFELLVN